MPLILHQALKDLRLLRWYVLAWIAALVALHGIFAYVMFAWPVDRDLLRWLQTIEQVLVCAATAALIVLAAFLIQSDSPATTTAFWVTRPVSARVMLAAKLLTALVLLLTLPIAGDVVDFVAAGVPLPSLSMWRMVYALAWLVPLMAIASVTVSLPQFVAVAIVEILIFSVLAFGASPLLGSRSVGPGFALSTLIATGIVILSSQYLSRRTRLGAAMLGVAPIAIVGLFGLWSRVPLQADASRESPADAMSISAPKDAIQVTDRVLTRYLDIPLGISDAGNGVHASVFLSRAWLQVGDRRVDLGGVAVPPLVTMTREEADQEASRVLGAVLGGATLFDPAHRLLRRPHVTAFATSADLDSIAAQHPVLHLDLSFEFMRYEVGESIPAREGARFNRPLEAVRVTGVRDADTEGVVISLREAGEFEALNRASYSGYALSLLRNRRLKQAVLTQPSTDGFFGSAGYAMPVFLAPVSQPLGVVWSHFKVDSNLFPMAARPTEWVRDAEVVFLQPRYLGTAEKTIEVRDVPLAPGGSSKQ